MKSQQVAVELVGTFQSSPNTKVNILEGEIVAFKSLQEGSLPVTTITPYPKIGILRSRLAVMINNVTMSRWYAM